MALLIVAVAVIASGGGACDEGPSNGDAAVGAVHAAGDVGRALGGAMLMTYKQAATGKEKEEEGDERCAICLSEYAEPGELVRVVPACGHFFHAECGVDGFKEHLFDCFVHRFRWPRSGSTEYTERHIDHIDHWELPRKYRSIRPELATPARALLAASAVPAALVHTCGAHLSRRCGPPPTFPPARARCFGYSLNTFALQTIEGIDAPNDSVWPICLDTCTVQLG
ncbi:hypothetical protein QYE76_063342 [Lolium multiflorum]|uniref:RING-type domain-containing protein n=1 Tax=Lolium multiflorum TaxID=4521 RepID=A0AAD8S789_LOLMU|nr:hypothetical protein QYE76_063342 [Lolium multiflorum]